MTSMFYQSRTKRVFQFIIGLTIAFAPRLGYCIQEVSVTDAPIPSNHWELSVISSYRDSQGKFDPYGNYSNYTDGSKVWSWMNMFNVGYRITNKWEVSMTVSERQSRSTYPSGSMHGDSFGNPSLEGRYHWTIPQVAHLMFYGGVSIPESFSVNHINGDPSKDSLSADGLDGGMINGWGVRLGAGAFRVIEPIRLRVAIDAGVTVPFAQSVVPQDAPDGTPSVVMGKSKIYSLREGVAYPMIWVRGLALNAGLSQQWEGDSTVNGNDIQTTASRSFGTSYGVSYSSRDLWRVSAAYQTPWPFYSYLANQPYSPSISVGMSYSGL